MKTISIRGERVVIMRDESRTYRPTPASRKRIVYLFNYRKGQRDVLICDLGDIFSVCFAVYDFERKQTP